MKPHMTIGYRVIATVSHELSGDEAFLRFSPEISRTEHEKWDGSGYPRGLVGETIPVSGCLMALVDACKALISRRCDTKPFPIEPLSE